MAGFQVTLYGRFWVTAKDLIGVWTLQSCVRTFPDGHKSGPYLHHSPYEVQVLPV